VYNAAIPDYIANGGDNMDFLKNSSSFNTGALIRDMLLNNVKSATAEGKSIPSINEKRIKE